MSEFEDPRVHPNLADASEGEPIDAEAAALARRLADLGPDVGLETPPAGLYSAIAAEVAREGEDAPTARPARLVPMERARWRAPWLAVAAAAAIVVAVTTAALVGDDGDEPTREEVALEGLAGFESARGVATLVVDGSARSVAVDLADVEVPSGSHLELWLLDEPVQELVPLGEVVGDGAHQIPAGVDLGATPIVDVSLEPDDGDPAHSGVSVARGRIDT